MKFCCAVLSLAGVFAAESYREQWRPQYHFSPAKNWTNDPNGLVFYKGEYHIFYQYNPFGDKWGHMSWGHAVSRDAVHWQHLPVALAEENGVMIFSGSVVVDPNTSGLCKGSPDCLVAIYTGHTSTKQSQHIAVSNDQGRSWTKFQGNPVLDLELKDFRDPKVLRFGSYWVMVVAMPDQHKVRFYKALDLKKWQLLSEFGPAGAVGGNWECPDIFKLGDRWVLSVNLMPGGVQGGSANQYFVGDFDGAKFTNSNGMDVVLWADYGADWYASTSYYGAPGGKRLWIGWVSNWLYANEEPTMPWRGVQSFPRQLTLREGRLVQTPIAELLKLRGEPLKMSNVSVKEANQRLASFRGTSYEIEVEGASEVRVLRGGGAETIVGLKGVVSIDRRKSGKVDFSETFAAKVHAGPAALGGKTRVFVDGSVVDVFANDGAAVMTERVFPPADADGMAVGGAAGDQVSLTVWKMRSSWK